MPNGNENVDAGAGICLASVVFFGMIVLVVLTANDAIRRYWRGK